MAHSVSIESTAAGLQQFVQRFGPQIQQSLKVGLEFENELPFVEADRAYTGQDVAITGGFQPYQTAFTPNNEESFDGITSFLQPVKVDLEFGPDQLEKFFSRWKANWFTPNPEDTRQGYAPYIMNNHILPQIVEDHNQASWSGEYAAPTPGAAGAASEAVDGFRKTIADQITAGRLTPINTGAITTMDVDTVRGFCNDIPEPYRYRSGRLFMSKTHAQSYSDSYKSTYSGNSAVINDQAVSGLRLRVDDYNKTVVGMTAMEGSDRVICVFDNLDSMIIGTRAGFPTYYNFRFETEDRNLKAFAEVYRFYSFETCLHMFVNEQV